ncbi:hypothetical protein [Pedobacter sp. ok626]|nr:hypothetical protein [Pedobacter sp. ok626]
MEPYQYYIFLLAVVDALLILALSITDKTESIKRKAVVRNYYKIGNQ